MVNKKIKNKKNRGRATGVILVSSSGLDVVMVIIQL
jgi:hypothetical protein